MKVKSLSHVRLFVTPWTVAYQAPLTMGFSRQAYWSGLPFPSPGDLPNPGIEPASSSLEADALTSTNKQVNKLLYHFKKPLKKDSEWVKVAQSCPTFCDPWTIQSMEKKDRRQPNEIYLKSSQHPVCMCLQISLLVGRSMRRVMVSLFPVIISLHYLKIMLRHYLSD